VARAAVAHSLPHAARTLVDRRCGNARDATGPETVREGSRRVPPPGRPQAVAFHLSKAV
jgi:hypothetical protein